MHKLVLFMHGIFPWWLWPLPAIFCVPSCQEGKECLFYDPQCPMVWALQGQWLEVPLLEEMGLWWWSREGWVGSQRETSFGCPKICTLSLSQPGPAQGCSDSYLEATSLRHGETHFFLYDKITSPEIQFPRISTIPGDQGVLCCI